jgi:hypothetical protein
MKVWYIVRNQRGVKNLNKVGRGDGNKKVVIE